VVDLVDADWGKTNWCRCLVSPYLVGGVTLVCVDELAWDDAVTEESLSVGEMGGGIACVAGGVVPSRLGELLFCALLKLGWVW